MTAGTGLVGLHDPHSCSCVHSLQQGLDPTTRPLPPDNICTWEKEFAPGERDREGIRELQTLGQDPLTFRGRRAVDTDFWDTWQTGLDSEHTCAWALGVPRFVSLSREHGEQDFLRPTSSALKWGALWGPIASGPGSDRSGLPGVA